MEFVSRISGSFTINTIGQGLFRKFKRVRNNNGLNGVMLRYASGASAPRASAVIINWAYAGVDLAISHSCTNGGS